jgi:hypothetical protein
MSTPVEESPSPRQFHIIRHPTERDRRNAAMLVRGDNDADVWDDAMSPS